MPTYYRYDGSVNAANGFALTGVEVYVCNQPATTDVIPPTPLATVYSDNAGADPITQPILTDGLGNFFFYAATGVYTVVYFDPLGRIPTTIFPDQQVVSPGGGAVTSVAMTGDGVIFASSISGSPVSSSGTFNLLSSLLTQSANRVLAGPASGSAAAPTFRALVSADFPAGMGTVTSVALALNGSAILSLAVSGSPVTGSGTLTGTINFANQSANTFLAGPSSGSPTAPAFRTITAADLSSIGLAVLQSLQTTLTSAQILALNTTGINLVPAPGVGFRIVPVTIFMEFFGGSAAYTDAGGLVTFAIQSSAVTLANNNIFLTTVSPNKRSQVFPWPGDTDVAGNPPTTDNAPLEILKATNNFAAGNGTMKITVYYFIQADT